jgi:hypothetical protein
MTIRQLIEFLQAHGGDGSATVQVSWETMDEETLVAEVQAIRFGFYSDGTLSDVTLEAK